MSARLDALRLLSPDPAALESFWCDLLGLGPEPGRQPTVSLRFAAGDVPRTGLNQMHHHLTSDTPEDQERIVRQALELGASHLDVGQLPEEGHLVLADPDGNEFCVLGDGNGFVAGCGFLGEIACDGTRAVGVFWSEALGWPLVWDEDEETAIQHPDGGTKVAWGGPPLLEVTGPSRVRFEVTAEGDLDAEVARLVGLGATVVGDEHGRLLRADPDGTQFLLSS